MKQPTQRRIRAIEASDRDAGTYAVYGENHLYIVGPEGTRHVARIDNIETRCRTVTGEPFRQGMENDIRMYFHHPYVCITERFRIHAALVNIETGKIRRLHRGDYNCDVSSYGIAFLEKDSKTLLLHQTDWNRLDIMDIETGLLLTKGQRAGKAIVISAVKSSRMPQW